MINAGRGSVAPPGILMTMSVLEMLQPQGLFFSRLAFAFDKVFHEHMLPVEHGVGELRDPVAQDEQPGGVREHQVQLDVAVAEQEEVDVGMRLQVLLGKDNQLLLVLAHVWWFAAVFTLQPRAAGPLQAEGHAPAGMDGGKQLLAQGVVEKGAQELELLVVRTQTVAVSQKECVAVQLHRGGVAV